MTKKRRRTRYFDRLRLRHVRCFKETDVPLDPQVTVVIGGNGSGKTTLVEAAAALTGGSDEPPTDFPLRRKTSNAEIALFDKGGQQPAAVWKLKGGTATLKRLPEERFLFAYGRYRRVFYPEDSEESPSDPSSDLDELVSRVGQRRTVTLYRPDNHLLRDMARYLAALHRGAESDPNLGVIFKRLNDSLAVLGQGISGIKMLKRDYGYVPRVIRSGFALEMRELSDGYQALLVIIFDLLLRYAYLFPFLVNPLEGEATVLIDEVDLHLHPRWQRTVITQLTELFPMTQFILTTHSPAVVQGAIDLGMKVVVPCATIMIRLDRGKVTVPVDWAKRVASKFTDYATFQTKAADFEKLPINSQDRENGFKEYAPEVLPKADFPQIWGEAKDELGKMSHRKCSYCESAIGHKGDGQVEHFKPKSLFPSFAYDWDNYFLACGGCNRPKSNKWPKDGGYVRPDQKDPAKEFLFESDGKMKAVKEDSDAGRTMRDFRLNEGWLVYWRKLTIEMAVEDLEPIIRLLYPVDKESARSKARSVVERYSNSKLPYSAAVTQCLRRAWGAACPDVPL